MTRVRRIPAALLGFLLVLSLVGCANKVQVTNTPPGVVDTEVANWYMATGAVRTLSEYSLQATQLAIQDHSLFPSETSYQTTLLALGKLQQIGKQATDYLNTVPQHFTSTAQSRLSQYLDDALAQFEIASNNGLLQIKNPDAQKAVTVFVEGLRSALKTIFALVKPAGTSVPAPLTKAVLLQPRYAFQS